jgi:tetratricopeptide (TPR) repeat protein
MAVTLPLILILYDIHFASTKKDIRYYIRYYAPFFLVVIFYILARTAVLGRFAQREMWWDGNISYTLLMMLKVVAGYIRLIFLPTSLKVDYAVDVSKSILETDGLIAIIMISIIAALYFVFRKQRIVSFYILWFFITLIPVYNIIPVNAIMDERFLYLPSIAFASLSGFVFSNLFDRFGSSVFARYTVGIMLVSIFVLYGAATISRNIEWRDELIFYTNEVLNSPTSERMHNNLGTAYLKEAVKQGQSENMANSYYVLAIKEFEKSISLKPNYQAPHTNLGNIYFKLGRYDLAVEYFKKAIAIKEDHICYNSLGVAYYNKRRYDEALKSFKRSLLLKPDYKEAFVNLGNTYFMKGEYAKARKSWSQAERLGETSPNVIENIKDLEKWGY